MSRRPEDPRVTDLQRYRKARELQKKRPPPRPPSEGFLGGRPHAGLILAVMILVLAALWILPRLH